MLRTTASKAVATARQMSTAAHLTPAAITNLSGRWEKLPESDKQDIIVSLAARQQLPWTELSLEEKKAAWYISFGQWGPRKPLRSAEDVKNIWLGVAAGLAVSFALFLGVRSQRNVPKTMNKEWQLKSDEYLASKNSNPFSTYSQVQSK